MTEFRIGDDVVVLKFGRAGEIVKCLLKEPMNPWFQVRFHDPRFRPPDQSIWYCPDDLKAVSDKTPPKLSIVGGETMMHQWMRIFDEMTPIIRSSFYPDHQLNDRPCDTEPEGAA